MAEPLTNPRELFAERLRTMLWIELTLAGEVLPQLAEEAATPDLVLGFERHLLETRGHVETLREVLAELAVHAEPEQSPVLEALVGEHEQLVKRIDAEDRVLRDLVHAQAAAATEHVEIASYELLAGLADALGEEEVGMRLRELSEQEEFALEQVERAATKLLAEHVESARS